MPFPPKNKIVGSTLYHLFFWDSKQIRVRKHRHLAPPHPLSTTF